MFQFPEAFRRLILELSRLPGIGERTAERLAFHLLKTAPGEAERLARSIIEVKKKVFFCSVCNSITERDPCSICSDPARDRSKVCVVEQPGDIIVIEKTGKYNGLYHVLMGVLSPLGGVGPEELRIKGLLSRLKEGEIKEVIIATSPNAEGEATAFYLAKILKPLDLLITRIGIGIPAGAELSYADEVTMARAIEGRREI
ncbi:MAG: recombination protein RecR [Acidobacteria bacterium]|nr:recombination protein RecR [Acidobacteriota bacterium]